MLIAADIDRLQIITFGLQRAAGLRRFHQWKASAPLRNLTQIQGVGAMCEQPIMDRTPARAVSYSIELETAPNDYCRRISTTNRFTVSNPAAVEVLPAPPSPFLA
jgi:hypothetical protein